MFERFGSLEYTGGWGEEVGEWHFLAFDVLKSRIGRWKNLEYGLKIPKFLLTFNPTKNWLYRIFYKPWRDKILNPEYSFTQSLFMDNSFTAEAYGQQLNSMDDLVSKARLRDGIWEYDDEDTVLIKFDSIIDMFTNPPEYSTEMFLTGDIARFGSDRIAYGLWRGWDLIKIYIKRHQGIDQTVTDLRTIMAENRVPYSHCIVDEDGVGGGVVDNLKGIKGFVNNSSPIMTKLAVDPSKLKKENYRNLKTQCSYLFAGKVNNHAVTISAEITEEDRELLIEELGQIRRKITGDDSTLQIITKEEIKENLGRSPDLSDMMMMRAYFELDKPKRFVAYDPALGFGGVNPYL
ncbi:MAG: terminase [Candidatus Moraniibacteriota bacterium]